MRDKGSQKGEIDFVIENEHQIVPIEVKAAEAGHLKSLFYFCKEKESKLGIKISLDPFSIKKVSHKIIEQQVQVSLVSIPQYAIEQTRAILKLAVEQKAGA